MSSFGAQLVRLRGVFGLCAGDEGFDVNVVCCSRVEYCLERATQFYDLAVLDRKTRPPKKSEDKAEGASTFSRQRSGQCQAQRPFRERGGYASGGSAFGYYPRWEHPKGRSGWYSKYSRGWSSKW